MTPLMCPFMHSLTTLPVSFCGNLLVAWATVPPGGAHGVQVELWLRPVARGNCFHGEL